MLVAANGPNLPLPTLKHDQRDRNASFLSDEDFKEIVLTTIQSPENKKSLLTN